MSKKLTYEEVKKFIEIDSGSGCKLLSREYNGNQEKLSVQCRCGEVFQVRYSDFMRKDKRQKRQCGYCSKIKTKEKICPICKTKFKPRKSSQKYCSPECRVKSMTNKITIKCSYCEKEISITKSTYERSKHHYCSQECKYEHQKQTVKGENNPNYKNATVKVRCSYCSKEFTILKCKIKNNKNVYCSQKCKSNHQREILKGENNPNYGKGEKIRGNKNKMWNPEKTQEEREKGRIIEGYKKWVYGVYKRDNYTCQYCGKRGGDLVAHHLNSYNWDKEHRTDINNGVTLCKQCHRYFHIKYGMGDNTKEQYIEFINNKKENTL
jgi:5-methylcytosine-specific restriction endonuclease McrA